MTIRTISTEAPTPTPDRPAPGGATGARTWHRPLLVLTAAMVALAVASVVGLLVDERTLLGQPIWAKPLKFALSIAIYAVTLAWLITLTRGRLRRVSWWAGTVSAVALVIEMVVIVGAVVAGTTSHFNVSTPLASVLWSVMAVSIVVVWIATLVVAFALFRAPLGDPARSLAIRAGSILALAGMALAFLMTSPTAAQLADFRGIAGAHSVGVADGGPGIPVLGWSTVAGDLRIPHFVGMHALQALVLFVMALEWAARRVAVLADVRVRFGLVAIATVLAAATTAIVTVQALMGESIVAPSAAIAGTTAVLWSGAAVAATLVVLRGIRRRGLSAAVDE
ncbi:hypothetical protein AVP42_01114 [Agromyces sp. NDB4Y10]|uniref:hypothetical protein n=1 Tax=Agromyces sp. NDB4Y10 TaxID=1775951 RepID=UPI0007B25B50|nr:hypothetical protein [Agromyces sp. NDB4Y10]KZE94335.1 hypothetical protein AVP42_01114 [Agromyces sp. NDB4Y10]